MGHVCAFSVDLGGCVADVAQDVPHIHRMGVIPLVVIPVFCWGERGHVQDRDLEAVACPPVSGWSGEGRGGEGRRGKEMRGDARGRGGTEMGLGEGWGSDGVEWGEDGTLENVLIQALFLPMFVDACIADITNTATISD